MYNRALICSIAMLIPLRREVTAISKDEATGNFTLTANHWEPQSYINYAQQQQEGGKNKNFVEQLFSSISMATAVILVLTRVLLKEAHVLSLYPELKDLLAHQRPWDVVVTVTLIVLLTTALMLMKSAGGGGSGAGETGAASSPVGDGGQLVTVEEMKVGGSGSSTVMGGNTFATEKIQCRYVVNAAGCNSDKIAKMIGDDSFQIKPRLGNYILLNRNQVCDVRPVVSVACICIQTLSISLSLSLSL
jgi:hypothetical protein